MSEQFPTGHPSDFGGNVRAKDLYEDKYKEQGGIAGEGFFDFEEDHWGNLFDAHGNRIDNATETGLESLNTVSIDKRLEQFLSHLAKRYMNAEELTDKEEAILRAQNRI